MVTLIHGGIRHVNLRVRDVAESAAFYRAIFGLTARRPTPNRTGVLVCSALNGGDRPFSIVLTQGLGGMTPTGMDHFAVGVNEMCDVDAAYELAVSMGVRATKPRMLDGNYQTYVFDPDGYKIEVFSESTPVFDDVDACADEDVSAFTAVHLSRAPLSCREAI